MPGKRPRVWHQHQCFGFWDWVGGRFSLWSAIGLPIAIAIGRRTSWHCWPARTPWTNTFSAPPLARNLPVRLGLLDIWYRNFHGFGSRCIAPYTTARCTASRPTCSSWRWKATASGVSQQGDALSLPRAPVSGASRAPMASTRSSRCCTKGRTVCQWSSWWCARPAHALAGHHDAAGGQRAGAGPGADAGPGEMRLGPPPLSGQPAQHVSGAGRL
jgi:glucose-6-phosphate isomerase